MSDLISRSALLEMLEHNKRIHTDENGETRRLIAVDIDRMIDHVLHMPAAYDVDKVAEKLGDFEEELKQLGASGLLSDMLEIVRGGAVS